MQPQLAQHPIWNSIKELLYRHDCVIVPNFGGFVCNREHTRIDQVSHLVTPPAKRIVFNQNLKTNDGLLAQRVSQALAITYSEALRSIDELVNQLRVHLEQIKQLDIEAFGSFRLNAEANYVFLPDKLNTYLYSSFGLVPLHATPVSGHASGARQTRIFKDRKEIREVRNLAKAKHIGLKMLTGTLIVMLVLNGYIFLTDANLIGGAKISTTGINSWFDSLMAPGPSQPVSSLEPEQPETVPAANIPPAPIAAADTTPAETLLPEPEQLPESNHALNLAGYFASGNRTAPEFAWNTTETALQPAFTPAPEAGDPEIKVPAAVTHNEAKGAYSYHVIGGVFCKEKNARQFYNRLRERGFEAELLLNKRINCNRVSYRKLHNLQEAIELMDSLKTAENPEAWILTVKE